MPHVGQVGGVVDLEELVARRDVALVGGFGVHGLEGLAVGAGHGVGAADQDVVGDGGGGLDDLDVALAFEAFLDDVHVEEAQEAAAEAEAQGLAVDGGEGEGGVVEGEFLDGVAEVFKVRAFALFVGGGVEVAEDHLTRRLVAGEGFLGGVVLEGDGVADADVFQRADRGDDVGGFAGADFGDADGLGRHLADVVALEGALLPIMRILSPTLSLPSRIRT